ncbi:DUF3592 domain-containing protein [Bacteroides oleiciplenus]|uniref:DUF3592 domain-containing protein n=1 Tax=Bacteroides oleiciplenus TaxID=626931 RepID=A0A3E5B3U4_9BACE|nr:hypothetical protein [Bacteroides oleiciplenus]RGN32271.1 hypothetical protein DXB65_18405 [Bacteroides oleiciplenus]
MKKIKYYISYSFGIVAILFISYLVIGGFIKKQSLGRNIEYAKAIIIDHFYTIRYTDFFSYKFSVNGQEYHGSGWHYPDSDTFSVGDTIRVVYDKVNPDNNKTYRDYIYSQKESPFIIPVLILMVLLPLWRYRKK